MLDNGLLIVQVRLSWIFFCCCYLSKIHPKRWKKETGLRVKKKKKKWVPFYDRVRWNQIVEYVGLEYKSKTGPLLRINSGRLCVMSISIYILWTRSSQFTPLKMAYRRSLSILMNCSGLFLQYRQDNHSSQSLEAIDVFMCSDCCMDAWLLLPF